MPEKDKSLELLFRSAQRLGISRAQMEAQRSLWRNTPADNTEFNKLVMQGNKKRSSKMGARSKVLHVAFDPTVLSK